MAAGTGQSRRERVRALTVREIKEHAHAQIAAGGPEALNLNQLAKAMGMSGPAVYRYFGSRDELLATLVTDSFEDLADTLHQVAEEVAPQAPESRLRAVAGAFRHWALGVPHRYRLVFGSASGSGALDPDRIIPAATRSMTTLLSAISDLDNSASPSVGDPILASQLEEWGARQGPGSVLGSGDLILGLTAWTRLHGILSLEIEGFFHQVGVDPARLYDREIDHLIAERVAHRV
jgi:AcrR family transcriptional regulator